MSGVGLINALRLIGETLERIDDTGVYRLFIRYLAIIYDGTKNITKYRIKDNKIYKKGVVTSI